MNAGRATALAIALAAVAGTASCTSSDSTPDAGGAPLPTIGLGSEAGRISGSAEARSIDVGEIDTLVMIGDSITVGSQPALEEQFGQLGFDEVTIVAQNSKRAVQTVSGNPSGVDIANFMTNGDPGGDELWVLALGTNDISQYESVERAVDELNELADLVPDGAPLVWIDTYFEDRPDDTAVINEAIERVVEERGNATVGRWSEIAPDDGVLSGDGVHPGNDGALVFAAFVTTTVSDFLQ